MRELARLGLPELIARFGLLNPEGFPITTGGSRNALLLHTAGELLLQVDDDTICRMTRPPEFRPGLAFSSRHDPTEFWFPGSEGSAPADADLLALHETLLGRCAADWAAAPDTDLTQARPECLRKLDRGRVLVTAAGVAGHSGMGSSLYFLSLDGSSCARLLSSVDAYRRALTHHQVVRTATRTTVCDGAYCMALNLGLDNRRMLPPFLPVQCNQDGVFAAVLRACRDDGLFGFLPGAVLHSPPDSRPLPDDDLWRSRGRPPQRPNATNSYPLSAHTNGPASRGPHSGGVGMHAAGRFRGTGALEGGGGDESTGDPPGRVAAAPSRPTGLLGGRRAARPGRLARGPGPEGIRCPDRPDRLFRNRGGPRAIPAAGTAIRQVDAGVAGYGRCGNGTAGARRTAGGSGVSPGSPDSSVIT